MPGSKRARFFAIPMAAAFLLLAVIADQASAAERVALVIGNAAYKHAPRLINPLNDAKDIGVALDRLGFVVTHLDDADQLSLRRVLQKFAVTASSAKVAIVFYAGHGIEVDKRNFLVPVDARLANDRTVEFETVPLDLVLRAVEGASGLGLVILDACRDNPFAVAMRGAGATRAIGRGLARVEPAGDTLLAYAAKAGTLASAVQGRNSAYSRALLTYLEQPDLELGLMFRRVRDAVLSATGGQQEPFVYGSLSNRHSYLGTRPTPPKRAENGTDRLNAELLAAERLFWESVRNSGEPAEIEAYLAGYPKGTYAALARARLKRLKDLAKQIRGSEIGADQMSDLLKKLTAQIARLDAENAALRRQLAGVVASHEDVEERAQELARIGKEARARAQALESAGKEAAAIAAAKATAMEAESQELKFRLATITRRLAAIEEENELLAAQLADALAARDALGKEADELGQVRAGLDERIKALVRQIAQLDAENRELATQLANAIAVRKVLIDQGKVAADLDDRIKGLVERIAQLDTENRRLAAIEEENERLAAQLADALAARDALGKEASELGRVRAGLDERIKALVKQIALLDAENKRLVRQLDAAREGGAEAEARVADLTDRQAALERKRADLSRQLAQLRDRNAQLRANLAAALRDRNSLDKTAGTLRERQAELIARLAEVERARERLRKLLAAAQKEGKTLGAKLGAADRQIAEMRSVSATQARQVLLLTQQLIALRRQLLSIQEALDVSEAQGKQQQLKISNLDTRLKAALVRQVNELKQYKSEFFGELRKTLGTRQDVRIVGDRFVFPSSVLFATNRSSLQEGGKVELRKLAATLKELAKKIPDDIDWILRVDGHTDVRVFKGGSNLELSARRAIAVVTFLTEEGIPPRRLFAAGFGSHHPIDPGDTEEAYRKNRRIEVRLTQR